MHVLGTLKMIAQKINAKNLFAYPAMTWISMTCIFLHYDIQTCDDIDKN